MVLNSGVLDNSQVLFPNSDGFRRLWHHGWICGKQVYRSLPPGWCETCYLAKLLAHVGVSDTLSYHHVDNPHYNSISLCLGEEFLIVFMVIQWGSVNLHCVALLNRLVLDRLLAAWGGRGLSYSR